ncbi:hypothetical protein SSBR45G_20820 [Bradyrhizobium sp. SSBR45G]|uniref:hypothetical protein n=1 Tax=unclassified Bradyrhizobium TaxID=2631580 RepID=UPI002342B058|nr:MULTISPECIES: hypothetical protein [unclassified Bradyrhizobium]GLH77174.1 hypothetical protein SSBR45G_20820 [Bradyrhizobium sp. SSBR45G]GLH83932.1 hypothetical protein SSBR45R_13920 [Bradyrhizobium sp. SSBR45R]
MNWHMCLLGAAVVASLGTSGGSAGQPRDTDRGREEIFILRSVREPAAAHAGFCAAERIGFAPFTHDAERLFSFWSVRADRAGRVLNGHRRRVATLRGCFGATDQAARQYFHADIELGQLAMKGRGECQALLLDNPEKGLFPVHCHLILSGLRAPYVGGTLTTNTITSRAPLGSNSDPPGYMQASIATIRLWKQSPTVLRDERRP